MKKSMFNGLTVSDLEIQKFGVEERIKGIEANLKVPLDHDVSEEEGQIRNQIILKRLLEIERSNLLKIKNELVNKKADFSDESSQASPVGHRP